MRDKCSKEPELSRNAAFPKAGSAARIGLVQMDAFALAYAVVSAAIVTLPAARTSIVPRCWERLCYVAQLGAEALRTVVLLPLQRAVLLRAALSAKLLCCVI